MPSVPNRYYNSPWIAQAAQNMSDALFGSPERELQSLQAQRLQQEIERDEQLKHIEADDRRRADEARAAFGNIPTADAATMPQALSDVFRLDPKLATPAMQAAGVYSPTYAQKLGLADATGQSRMSLAQYNQGQAWNRAQLGADTSMYGVDQRFLTAGMDRAQRLLLAREQMTLRKELADQVQRMKQLHGIDITPQESIAAMQTANYLAQQYGGVLSATDLKQVMARFGGYYKTTQDAATAMAMAFDEQFPGGPQVDSGWFGFGDDTLTRRPGAAPTATPPPATAPPAAPTRPPLSSFQR